MKCTVSLLYDYEKAKNVYDWEVGKHGVFLQFKDCGEDFEATYLPEVPKKKGWSVEDTVKELITKSGYKKEMTKYKLLIDVFFIENYWIQQKLIDTNQIEYI